MDKKIDTIGFQLYDKWLRLYREGKRLECFFNDNFYSKIAIYGMGLIGMQLYEELMCSDIQVIYAIDQKAKDIYVEGLNILIPDCLEYKIEKPEAIVVTPVQCFYEIEKMLLGKVKNAEIISVEQIVEYVSRHG